VFHLALCNYDRVRNLPLVALGSIPVTAAHVKSNTRHDVKLHPLPVRLMHWINALAMIIMIGSGWKIYNDEVIFGWLHFPEEITLGKWAQHGLQWHFFGMWILVFNGLAYLTYGFVSGRFRRKFLPLSWHEIIATMRDALAFRLKHDDLTQYNAVQKLLYIRHHSRRHRYSSLRPLDLEARAALGAGDAVLRLSDRAPGAFPLHDGYRDVPDRARRAYAAGAANLHRHAYRRPRYQGQRAARRRPAGLSAGNSFPSTYWSERGFNWFSGI